MKKKVARKVKKTTRKSPAKPVIVAVTEDTPTLPEIFDPTVYGLPIPRAFEAQKKRLIESRDTGEDADKTQAIILTTWRESRLHEADGYAKFEEWAGLQAGLAPQTVRVYVKLLDSFNDIARATSADPAIFKRLSPSHIFQVHRAVKSNALTPAQVRKLLPLADREDPKYIAKDQMKIHIDRVLGVAAGETGLVLKTYALKPESGEAQEVIESCLQSLKNHPIYKDFSQSQVLEKGLIEFTANHGGDTGSTKFLTFQAAWNLVASLCPEGVAPVIVVTDMDKARESGLGPVESKLVRSAFMGFPGYDHKTVLSTSKKRASDMIGVAEKQVREYPLEIDTGLLPKMLSQHWEKNPIPAEDTPITEVLEEAEEAPLPPLPPADEILKMSKEEVYDFAAAHGIQFTKRAKRDNMIKTLLTETDLWAMSDKAADALISGRVPDLVEATEEAAADLEEALEEAPEEAPKEIPEKVGAPMSMQDIADAVKENLTALKKANALDREMFAEYYNSLPKNSSENEKNEKVLAWTRDLAKKKNVKVR